jgi:hypothetical protein
MAQMIGRLLLGASLVLGLAAPAAAQDAAAPVPAPPAAPAAVRRAPAPPATFRAYGQFDWMAMSASQSFDAVLGSSTLAGFGVGGEYLDIWKGLFFRGAYGRRGGTGTRVFVFEGEVVDLGIPQEVRIRDLTFGGGWRHGVHPRVVAYGGAGFVRVSHTEISSIFVTEESNSFWGQTFFGGAELALGQWFFTGAEVEWRTVAGALGEFQSASMAFGETNLGGTALRVLVGIRR